MAGIIEAGKVTLVSDNGLNKIDINYNGTVDKTVNWDDIENTVSNHVDLTSDQTISGDKIFSGKVTVAGTTFGDPSIYLLGQPGQLGFGVATAPQEIYNRNGMVPMPGHDMIGSDNYGNYMHLASGAIMCYVPKHYYKITGNLFEYSDTLIAGYVLERTFINAGIEIPGIFVSKYTATNNNGKLSSQPGKGPLSTATDNNPIGSLTGAPSNTYGGSFAAVKTMDSNAVLTPIWAYYMLARMSIAHGQTSTNTSVCAYIDVDPKMPKGNLNSSLADYNDTSCTFTSAGNATHPNCALVGSGNKFAKTTHNGQNCGIADLCGNVWECASGFIRTDANGFLVMKESTNLKNIINDSTTTGTGAYDINLYEVINISDVVSANDGWIYYGNNSNQVFGFSTTRTDANYKRTSIGIPLSTGHSAAGTTQFGNDGLYRYLRDEMLPLVGADWDYAAYGGALALYLHDTRSDSYASVSLRASILA